MFTAEATMNNEGTYDNSCIQYFQVFDIDSKTMPKVAGSLDIIDDHPVAKVMNQKLIIGQYGDRRKRCYLVSTSNVTRLDNRAERFVRSMPYFTSYLNSTSLSSTTLVDQIKLAPVPLNFSIKFM